MVDITLHRANLVALWLETLLDGVFLVFFCASLYVLLVKKLQGRVNRYMLGSHVSLDHCSEHLICDLIRAIKAFTSSLDPIEYYANIAEPYEWAKTIIYYLLNVVGDSIVLYRCYIIWNKNMRVMALPLTLYLADISAGAVSTHALIKVKPGQLIFVSDLAVWVLTFFSLTLSLNIICTFLIASRIWYITRATDGIRTSRRSIWTVAVILIESAAIYSASLIAMIGTYLGKTNAQYITLDTLPPIIGIVFELIIVRVALGHSSNEVLSTVNNKSHSGGSSGTNIYLQRLGRPRNIDITVETVIDEPFRGSASVMADVKNENYSVI